MPKKYTLEDLVKLGYTPIEAKKALDSGEFDKVFGEPAADKDFLGDNTTIQSQIDKGIDPATAQTRAGNDAFDLNFSLPPTQSVSQGVTQDSQLSFDTSGQGESSVDPEIQALIDKGYTREEAYQMRKGGQLPDENATGTSPEIQAFIDQGYNLEEATQLSQSNTFSQTGETPETSDDVGATGNGLNSVLDFGAAINGSNDLETSAQGLGEAIGSEKGSPGRGLAIAGNAGKLLFSGARNVASGIGRSKRSQYIEDFNNKKKLEERNTYTAAPQTQNTNYLGGNSYGEKGGTKGKNLPLKNHFSNKGFRKPGYKKL